MRPPLPFDEVGPDKYASQADIDVEISRNRRRGRDDDETTGLSSARSSFWFRSFDLKGFSVFKSHYSRSPSTKTSAYAMPNQMNAASSPNMAYPMGSLGSVNSDSSYRTPVPIRAVDFTVVKLNELNGEKGGRVGGDSRARKFMAMGFVVILLLTIMIGAFVIVFSGNDDDGQDQAPGQVPKAELNITSIQTVHTRSSQVSFGVFVVEGLILVNVTNKGNTRIDVASLQGNLIFEGTSVGELDLDTASIGLQIEPSKSGIVRLIAKTFGLSFSLAVRVEDFFVNCKDGEDEAGLRAVLFLENGILQNFNLIPKLPCVEDSRRRLDGLSSNSKAPTPRLFLNSENGTVIVSQ